MSSNFDNVLGLILIFVKYHLYSCFKVYGYSFWRSITNHHPFELSIDVVLTPIGHVFSGGNPFFFILMDTKHFKMDFSI